MPLHLVKLCVGCDSIADLEAWIAQQLKARGKRAAAEHVHVTRMFPKRTEALLAGGSLYWVIRGMIACRQQLRELRPLLDARGGRRCGLVLDPAVIPVQPVPMRAFQGWRYLDAGAAPPDLPHPHAGNEELPEALRRELYALGLL